MSLFWSRYGSYPVIDVSIPYDLKTCILTEYNSDFYDFLDKNYDIKYNEEYFKLLIDNRDNIVLVLIEDEMIIGSITAVKTRFNIGESYIINHLCVKENRRTNGLCTILISSISSIIYGRNCTFALYSLETRVHELAPLSVKTSFIFVMNPECYSMFNLARNEIKTMKKNILKRYNSDLYTICDITELSKKDILRKYKKDCKNRSLYLDFKTFDDMVETFFNCVLLYDKNYNFVFLEFNNIKHTIRRCFVRMFVIDNGNKDFINRIIIYLKDKKICDVLQFNCQENNYFSSFVKTDCNLYYYLYNYNIGKTDDNIYIT